MFIQNQNSWNALNDKFSETAENILKKSDNQDEFSTLNSFPKAFKIVPKDQDCINSFCINEVIINNNISIYKPKS